MFRVRISIHQDSITFLLYELTAISINLERVNIPFTILYFEVFLQCEVQRDKNIYWTTRIWVATGKL